MIAVTPEPPYYAVIFTSLKTPDDTGYSEMAEEMVELAKKQDGFLGIESARNETGITVSYWRSLEDIQRWKENERHLIAQKKGKEQWYQAYRLRICKVEKEYGVTVPLP